jgi:ABC-type oligopeptide transport system substrate-binding subunit
MRCRRVPFIFMFAMSGLAVFLAGCTPQPPPTDVTKTPYWRDRVECRRTSPHYPNNGPFANCMRALGYVSR